MLRRCPSGFRHTQKLNSSDWIHSATVSLHSQLEAELIAALVLNVDRTSVIARDFENFDVEFANQLLCRRLTGEPIAYILGKKEFFGRDFFVNNSVLIPRPETELLINEAIRSVKPEMRCLDVGTGSGCIAITLDLEVVNCFWKAIDVSGEAILVATKNKEKYDSSVELVTADFGTFEETGWDLIVSNPPYVALNDPNLDEMVAKWEPETALYAKNCGTEFIEVLIEKSKEMLNPDGILAFEFGIHQSEFVAKKLESWTEFKIMNDLAGIPRIAIASMPCS